MYIFDYSEQKTVEKGGVGASYLRFLSHWYELFGQGVRGAFPGCKKWDKPAADSIVQTENNFKGGA